jgi:effector-binding domain-containing protein
MTVKPQIVARRSRPYVAIPVTAGLAEWGRVNALVPEIQGWLAARNVLPDGPLFYRYLVATDPADPFDVEVGYPLADAMPGDGRVVAGAIPPGRYATLVHEGHPDGIRHSFARLEGWLAGAEEHVDAEFIDDRMHWAGRFEFYLMDPTVDPDPADWRTEIAWRLRDE